MTKYVNLHLHNYYSPMDGYSSPEEYVARASEIGVDFLAETNHGHTIGWRHHQRVCKDAGLSPILGLESYFSPTDRWDKRAKKNREEADSIYNHLILLAKNDNGARNIQAGNAEAWSGEGGFYLKPRWDMELLKEHSEDLIVLSGCLNGPIAKAYERGDIEAAEEWAKQFYEVFGENFYIEIQSHNPPELNHSLLVLADRMNIKPVITDDCHHASKEDKIIQEIFLILSTHPKIDKTADLAKAQKMDLLERFDYLYPDRKMTFKNFDLYLESYAEKSAKMAALGLDRQDIYSNTVDIANSIEGYSYHENLDTLPKIVDNPDEVIREKVYAGLKRLKIDTPEYRARADYELGVITDKDFSNYFLIVEDIVAWGRKQKIRFGPGRGSGPGSLVNYALDITRRDPIKHNLLFSRFLDPSRDDFPDIDIDVQDDRRSEIIDYTAKRFGHVANISTTNKYSGKSALKAAARALGVPYGPTNKVMKCLEGIDEITGHDVIAEFEKAKPAKEFNSQYPDVLKVAKMLYGRVTGYGMHAAGIVVANRPLDQYAPMESRSPAGQEGRVPCLGLDKYECESVGLIKIDFLGLTSLTIIDECLNLIRKNTGKIIDLDQLSYDDKDVFAMLAEGRTLGVFQCEQGAYTKLLIQMGCDSFEDLVASNALVRPGAWNAIGKDYIKAKQRRKVNFIHDDVSEFMDETWGYPVYQEQLMKLAVSLAGFTEAESNELRRGIAKKKRSVIDKLKPQFIEGASKKVSKDVAEKIWTSCEESGAYAFNKSHADVYSMLSYTTAWLKYHYPLEFMCAILKHESVSTRVTDYLLECKSLGIKVKLPHINHSESSFCIEGDALRMGLSNVKYLSDVLAQRIIKNAPYENYTQFRDHVMEKGSGLNTRVLSSLNAFGGAAFEDNPVPEDYKSKLYEYLNVPAFDSKLVTTRMREYLLPLEEYVDDDTFFVMAMVKNVKVGTGWKRVDMVDSSGTAGVFAEPEMDIVKNRQYIFLIGNNKIIKVIDLEAEIDDATEILLDYLRRPVLEEVVPGQYKILAAKARKTKSNDNMATIVVCNDKKELKTIVVFKDMFNMARMMCKLGSVRTIELGKSRNGGEFMRSVY